MHIVQYRQWPRQAAGQMTRQITRQEQIHRLFERFPRHAAANTPTRDERFPRVDIYEEAGRFLIIADLPGVDPADIDIRMDKGVLSLKGQRAAVEVGEGSRYSRVERQHGEFQRDFALPDSADADRIVANGHNGVLEISIPKKAESEPRRIQVGTLAPADQ